MYATEYDLIVAEDRFRDLRHEMRAIRLAQAAQAEMTDHQSLFDRLIGMTSRGARIWAPRRKVGAAA
jgi:hypothetical protein